MFLRKAGYMPADDARSFQPPNADRATSFMMTPGGWKFHHPRRKTYQNALRVPSV